MEESASLGRCRCKMLCLVPSDFLPFTVWPDGASASPELGFPAIFAELARSFVALDKCDLFYCSTKADGNVPVCDGFDAKKPLLHPLLSL